MGKAVKGVKKKSVKATATELIAEAKAKRVAAAIAAAEAAQAEAVQFDEPAPAMELPIVQKIMQRSNQKVGMVARGTVLSSGARQATVTFPPPVFRKLKLAADANGVSLSEMVRQCVNRTLEG